MHSLLCFIPSVVCVVDLRLNVELEVYLGWIPGFTKPVSVTANVWQLSSNPNKNGAVLDFCVQKLCRKRRKVYIVGD